MGFMLGREGKGVLVYLLCGYIVGNYIGKPVISLPAPRPGAFTVKTMISAGGSRRTGGGTHWSSASLVCLVFSCFLRFLALARTSLQ